VRVQSAGTIDHLRCSRFDENIKPRLMCGQKRPNKSHTTRWEKWVWCMGAAPPNPSIALQQQHRPIFQSSHKLSLCCCKWIACLGRILIATMSIHKLCFAHRGTNWTISAPRQAPAKKYIKTRAHTSGPNNESCSIILHVWVKEKISPWLHVRSF